MPRSVREHFPWLTAQERDRLFHRPPGGVASDAPAGQLGAGLGATIYIPSGRPNLLAALRQAGECGAVAAVVCLEDSVATEDLLAAEFSKTQLDPALAPMYAQMLVGLVALTGQWWLDNRDHGLAKDVVAAHVVNLAWNGMRHLEVAPRLGRPRVTLVSDPDE